MVKTREQLLCPLQYTNEEAGVKMTTNRKKTRNKGPPEFHFSIKDETKCHANCRPFFFELTENSALTAETDFTILVTWLMNAV